MSVQAPQKPLSYIGHDGQARSVMNRPHTLESRRRTPAPDPAAKVTKADRWTAFRSPLAVAALLSLTSCATQVSSAVAHTPTTPGFLLGLWHGFIFPAAWVLSLFLPDVAVYAVPNTGGWYDFGYFLGIVVFGVGARKSRTVYVTRRASR